MDWVVGACARCNCFFFDMDWVPGRTWGWLGPSGSLCNELSSFLSYGTWGWLDPSGSLCNELFSSRSYCFMSRFSRAGRRKRSLCSSSGSS
jgi:hypothetical protein